MDVKKYLNNGLLIINAHKWITLLLALLIAAVMFVIDGLSGSWFTGAASLLIGILFGIVMSYLGLFLKSQNELHQLILKNSEITDEYTSIPQKYRGRIKSSIVEILKALKKHESHPIVMEAEIELLDRIARRYEVNARNLQFYYRPVSTNRDLKAILTFFIKDLIPSHSTYKSVSNLAFWKLVEIGHTAPPSVIKSSMKKGIGRSITFERVILIEKEMIKLFVDEINILFEHCCLMNLYPNSIQTKIRKVKTSADVYSKGCFAVVEDSSNEKVALQISYAEEKAANCRIIQTSTNGAKNGEIESLSNNFEERFSRGQSLFKYVNELVNLDYFKHLDKADLKMYLLDGINDISIPE